MKTNKLIYSLSLALVLVVIFLIVQYPNSGRLSLIAGVLTPIAFVLNVFGYMTKKE